MHVFYMHFLTHQQSSIVQRPNLGVSFFLKNVGLRGFTETILALFPQKVYSLLYELHYPLPPLQNYISQMHCNRGSTDKEGSPLDFFLHVDNLFCHQVVSRGLKG